MIGERARGVVLYALSVALLLAGGWWYALAAPDDRVDPRLPGWQIGAERLLPDLPNQTDGDTAVLAGTVNTDRSFRVDVGVYRLSAVCFGVRGTVWVRLSSSGNDSGRPVACAEAPTTVAVEVALADDFFMHLGGSIDPEAAVVFRWRLDFVENL